MKYSTYMLLLEIVVLNLMKFIASYVDHLKSCL